MRFIVEGVNEDNAESGRRTVETQGEGNARAVTLDGRTVAVNWSVIGGARLRAASGRVGHYSALIGDASYEVFVRALPAEEAPSGGRAFEITVNGRAFRLTAQDERAEALASLAGAGRSSGEASLRAPMPGLVTNVLAQVGEMVQRGQTVIALEAMKMENELGAPRAGVVLALPVSKGQTVNQGDTLAIIGDAAGGAEANGDETPERRDEMG